MGGWSQALYIAKYSNTSNVLLLCLVTLFLCLVTTVTVTEVTGTHPPKSNLSNFLTRETLPYLRLHDNRTVASLTTGLLPVHARFSSYSSGQGGVSSYESGFYKSCVSLSVPLICYH